MKQAVRFDRWKCGFIIGLLVMVGSAPAAKVDKIIKEMQKTYRSAQSIAIHFQRIDRFSLTGTQSEVRGTFYMAGRNKFRLDSEDQLLVNDGTTLWRYNKLDNQVLIDYAKTEEQQGLFNDFLYELHDKFFGEILEERTDQGKKTYVIKLVPKTSTDSYFTFIKLWVVDKSWRITRVVYVDYNENQTEFAIEKMEFNPTLPDSTFRFIPPEGVEVIDLRF